MLLRQLIVLFTAFSKGGVSQDHTLLRFCDRSMNLVRPEPEFAQQGLSNGPLPFCGRRLGKSRW
jgi:hypothetical protein